MREFFKSKMKWYCPPMKDMNVGFCKDILSGKKKLLKFAEVNWIENVPQWEEFTAQYVWNSVKNDRTITCYFQEYTKTFPSRDYLLNVVNTSNTDSVKKAVAAVKQGREVKETEEMPIIITNEIA